MNDSIFWDISRPLSYNALLNFIVGNRGGGKTFGCKKFVIKDFIKTGAEFVYLRRYKPELRKAKKFFDDIITTFPENKLEVKGREMFIDDQVAGYAMPLSTAKIEKSVSFPKVKTIIFDEFIIDKGTYHYLPDEVTTFLEFYETIARMRDDVKVFFLSNALTMINPYFLYFDIHLPYNGKTIYCKNDILIELVQKEKFIEQKKNTRFGKLISGTPYGDYAIENKFLRDSSTFIAKKTGNCQFMFTLVFQGQTFGVWRSFDAGALWVSYDYEHNSPRRYALTKEDHTDNTLLIAALKNTPIFQAFKTAFERGYLFFENQKIKAACYEIMKTYWRY